VTMSFILSPNSCLGGFFKRIEPVTQVSESLRQSVNWFSVLKSYHALSLT